MTALTPRVLVPVTRDGPLVPWPPDDNAWDETWGHLYRLAHRAVVGTKMVPERDQPDVEQETVVVVRAKYEPARKVTLAAYTYGVARNKALDYRDRQKHQPRTVDMPQTPDGAVIEPADPRPGGDGPLSDAEVLHAAIRELAPEVRGLFVLRFLEQWPVVELARRFQISEPACHVRLSRAKQQVIASVAGRLGIGGRESELRLARAEQEVREAVGRHLPE